LKQFIIKGLIIRNQSRAIKDGCYRYEVIKTTSLDLYSYVIG